MFYAMRHKATYLGHFPLLVFDLKLVSTIIKFICTWFIHLVKNSLFFLNSFNYEEVSCQVIAKFTHASDWKEQERL